MTRGPFSYPVELVSPMPPSEVARVLQERTGSEFRVWGSDERPLSGDVYPRSCRFVSRSVWQRSAKVLELEFRENLQGGTILSGYVRMTRGAMAMLWIMAIVFGGMMLGALTGGASFFGMGFPLVLAAVLVVVIRWDMRHLGGPERDLLEYLEELLHQGQPMPSVGGGVLIRPRRRGRPTDV